MTDNYMIFLIILRITQLKLVVRSKYCSCLYYCITPFPQPTGAVKTTNYKTPFPQPIGAVKTSNNKTPS